jgi:hypothetical protein
MEVEIGLKGGRYGRYQGRHDGSVDGEEVWQDGRVARKTAEAGRKGW